MKYNSHVQSVNLSSSSASASSDRIRNLSSSSSCVLRWPLSPADDSSSVTQLVRNSFTRFDVLCTRLQLFLLHGLNQTAGDLPVAVHVSKLSLHMTLVGDRFLELDGSRVHVINAVDDIECAFCVIHTRSNPERCIEGPSLSPQRSAAALVELSPGSTVDPHSNCRGAEFQFQAVDVN